MCEKLMAQKKTRTCKYSRVAKVMLMEYMFDLQECEDDEHEPHSSKKAEKARGTSGDENVIELPPKLLVRRKCSQLFATRLRKPAAPAPMLILSFCESCAMSSRHLLLARAV